MARRYCAAAWGAGATTATAFCGLGTRTELWLSLACSTGCAGTGTKDALWADSSGFSALWGGGAVWAGTAIVSGASGLVSRAEIEGPKSW